VSKDSTTVSLFSSRRSWSTRNGNRREVVPIGKFRVAPVRLKSDPEVAVEPVPRSKWTETSRPDGPERTTVTESVPTDSAPEAAGSWKPTVGGASSSRIPWSWRVVVPSVALVGEERSRRKASVSSSKASLVSRTGTETVEDPAGIVAIPEVSLKSAAEAVPTVVAHATVTVCQVGAERRIWTEADPAFSIVLSADLEKETVGGGSSSRIETARSRRAASMATEEPTEAMRNRAVSTGGSSEASFTTFSRSDAVRDPAGIVTTRLCGA
jgi:hypothetical protein